ncbi:hypothetical protein MTO96_038980, partial [Rhipicephalus appendiculatus]
GGDKRLQQALRSASIANDALWRKTFAEIPRKPRKTPAHQAVHVLGPVEVLVPAKRALSLGPKFCVHPQPDKVKLLSYVRSASARTGSAEGFDSCVSEGVDVLRTMPKAKSAIHIKQVVSSLREADLKLVLSDKEGGFVVMTSGTYAEKAREAITSNFHRVHDVDLEKVKKQALKPLKRCEDLKLGKIATSIKKSQH